MKNKRGFTLIELMIVVVIIGILTAMGVARYNITTHKSKEKEADMVLAQVYRLQEAFMNEHGRYATTPLELQAVGFREPNNLRHYAWGGSVTIPLCLAATGPWNNRRVDATGDITNC